MFSDTDCCFGAKLERPICLTLGEYEIEKRDLAEKENA